MSCTLPWIYKIQVFLLTMFFCFSRSPTYYLWIQYLGAIDTFCPVLTTRAVAVTGVIPDLPFGRGKRYKLNMKVHSFFWIPSPYLHMPLGQKRAVTFYLIWVIVQVYCLSLHQTCSHSLLVKVIPHPTCWTCCHSCQPLHSQCPDFWGITCSVKVDQKVCSGSEEKGENGQDPK